MVHWFKKWITSDPLIMKKLFKCRTIVGSTEQSENTPYMTRLNVGKFFIHVFWRGDADEDCHDHPWDFWTFPLYPRAGYYEAYVHTATQTPEFYAGDTYVMNERYERVNRVEGWKWTFRPAEYTHRVLYPASCDFGFFKGDTHYGSTEAARKDAWHADWPIVTFVIKQPVRRAWGFLRNREGKWCWTPWRDYVFGNGKNAPC